MPILRCFSWGAKEILLFALRIRQNLQNLSRQKSQLHALSSEWFQASSEQLNAHYTKTLSKNGHV